MCHTFICERQVHCHVYACVLPWPCCWDASGSLCFRTQQRRRSLVVDPSGFSRVDFPTNFNLAQASLTLTLPLTIALKHSPLHIFWSKMSYSRDIPIIKRKLVQICTQKATIRFQRALGQRTRGCWTDVVQDWDL